MTDEEFDVLDELYFVISFDDLKEATTLASNELKIVLQSIHQKGWVKVMESVDDELSPSSIDWANGADKYFFLATKKGLLAHNS